MKTKMSYKSKKIAIITAIILVLIGGISIGIYYYNKGNAEIKASTDENVVNNSSENLIITDETSETNETEENVAENSVEETNNTSSNNDVEETENTETTNSNNTVSNNGTSNNENSDEELPNEEYTQIDRIETGRQILVREGLAVGWVNAGLNKANVSTNILVNRPELEVHKQAKINSISQEDNSVQVGSKITYEITVKNNSKTVDAKNVTVTDKIPEGTTLDTETPISNEGVLSDGKITWLVDVNKESSVTVSFTVIVESTEGDIKNVAIADGKDSEETTNPVISTNKSVSSEENMNELKEGSKVKYTISVTNNGNEVAKTTVKDSAPEGTTLVENSTAGIDAENISVDGNNITWNNVELNPGETKLLTFEVTVNAFEGESKVIENIALVGDKTTNPSDITVYNPIINSEKTSNKTAVVVGEEIEYTITVTNSGKVEGTAKVTDTIPEGTSFVEGSIKVNGEARKDLGETDLNTGIDLVLGAGEEGTVSFKVTVNEEAKGTIINTAKVNGNDTNTEQNPIFKATKSVSQKTIKEGEKLVYTITVTNTGKVEGTAKVADEKPEGTSFVEGSIKVSNSDKTYTETDLNNGIDVTVPAQGKVTVTFEVTVGKLENNAEIKNTASLNGKPTNEVTTTFKEPELQISKTAETVLDRDNGVVIPGQDPEKAEVGDTIVYTIKVNNVSDVETEVNLEDKLPDHVSFVNGSIKVTGGNASNASYENRTVKYTGTLAGGKELKIEFRVTVNENTPVGTDIKNIATVNGKDTNETNTHIVKKVTVTTTAQTMNSLDLVLVLDTSGSMKDPGTNGKTRMENLKEAATNLVNRVFSTNTDSTITAITYDTDVNWGTRTYSFSGKQQLLNKIKGLSANGGTNIYKALEETNNVIDDMSGTNRTRVVVFLTDGAPTYWSYADGANHVTNNNKNESGSYRNNLRPQIIAQANELKAKENVTVYSVGLGVNNLNNSSEVQYVEKNPPQNVRDYFNGYSNRWGYWYMYTRTYAQYLLNNISSSGKYIEPSNLNDTFDDILSEQTTSKHVYDAEELPVTIQINETREILGNVTVKIGDNGREREYSLAQLRRGVNGLTYVYGTGFTWVISDDSILNENLYISYKVEGVAE